MTSLYLKTKRQPTADELAEIRATIAKMGKPYVSGGPGKAGYSYTPIPFEGLADVPHHRPDSWERWRAISGAVDLAGRDVLDLGCATGFFCFMAASVGAIATGIDYDPNALKVCRLLKAAYGYGSEVGFEPTQIRGATLLVNDIVLAMSILHWVRLAAGDDGMARITRMIAERCKVAFIEMPIWGSGGAGVPWLKAEEDVGAWLREQGFASVEPLVDVSSHAGRRRTWMCRGQKVRNLTR